MSRVAIVFDSQIIHLALFYSFTCVAPFGVLVVIVIPLLFPAVRNVTSTASSSHSPISHTPPHPPARCVCVTYIHISTCRSLLLYSNQDEMKKRKRYEKLRISAHYVSRKFQSVSFTTSVHRREEDGRSFSDTRAPFRFFGACAGNG